MLVSRTRAASCSSKATATPVVRSVSSRTYTANWCSETRCNSMAHTAAVASIDTGAPKRKVVQMMGNKATGGPFAPIVVVTRNIMGEKPFNQLRGKAISLHSQVIKDFCGTLGADTKQVQGLIRLAKKNGEKLGFLA